MSTEKVVQSDTCIECQFPIVSDYKNNVIRVGDYVFYAYCPIDKNPRKLHYIFDIMDRNGLGDWYRETAVKTINQHIGYRDYWKMMVPVLGPKFNARLHAAMVGMWISPCYNEICRYVLVDYASPNRVFESNRAMIVRYHIMMNEVRRLRGTSDEPLITLVTLFMRSVSSLKTFLGRDALDKYVKLSKSKQKSIAAFFLKYFEYFNIEHKYGERKKITARKFNPELFRLVIEVPSRYLKYKFIARSINTPEKFYLFRTLRPTWSCLCDAENYLFFRWESINRLKPGFISPFVGGERLIRHFKSNDKRYWGICNSIKLSYDEFLIDSFYGYYSSYRLLPNKYQCNGFSAQLIESDNQWEQYLRQGILRYLDYRDSFYDQEESFGLYAIKKSGTLIGYVFVKFSLISGNMEIIDSDLSQEDPVEAIMLSGLTDMCRQSINYFFKNKGL
jgi:hypothetical protein